MAKIIRPTYPAGFSTGLLLLIFVVAFFLSQQIFDVRIHNLNEDKRIYLGMFLASLAVIIMVLIIWEEFLFPVGVETVEGGIIFRNHRTKLLAQVLIYCTIPAIFIYLYMDYDVNHVRFFIWAIICTGMPAIEKLFSGINNYNDFLRLTTKEIEYKNNEKEGCFSVIDLKRITIIKDERNIIQKIQLLFSNNDKVTIDLDEMELDDFYVVITDFITTNYADIVKFTQVARTL